MNSRILRWLVFAIVAIIIGVSASSLFAAGPMGESPANALPATCQVESMAAGGTVWHKIPYHKGMELVIELTAIEGVYFDVFAPDQARNFPSVGQSLGRSVPDPNDPIYQRSWKGHLEQGEFLLDYYYVRITNTIGIEAQYQLCFKEIESLVVEPTGDSPMNGLTTEPCVLQLLDANSQLWHKVPYHAGKEFEMYLQVAHADLNFDVFTPEQIRAWPQLGQPIGRGTVNRHEPEYAKSWQGHLLRNDYYYVRVTNASDFAVYYQLCLIEKELPGPYESPTPIRPTPTPRSRSQ